MTDDQLQAKLNELRALPNEVEWTEFKQDDSNPQEIGGHRLSSSRPVRRPSGSCWAAAAISAK